MTDLCKATALQHEIWKGAFFKMSRGLFGRVGKRIEGLAIFLFTVGTLTSLAFGIYFIVTAVQNLGGANIIDTLLQMFRDGTARETVGYPLANGIILVVGGPIVSWIVSWFIYGYGEFIDSNT